MTLDGLSLRVWNLDLVKSKLQIPSSGGNVPVGGTTGQVLTKLSNLNFDTDWQTPASGVAWGDITGTLSSQNDLQSALNVKVDTTDPRLSDARTPLAHETTHRSGGTDPLSVLNLAGFPGGTTTFLRSDGSFNTPPDTTGITQLTGDVTAGPGAGSQGATIPNTTVTYAKMQNVSATSRLLGRITGGAGSIEELTGTQATTLLDAFTSTLKGLAPASGGGTANFLRADGSWAAPTAAAADLDLPETGSLTIATAKYHLTGVRHSATSTQRITASGTARWRLQN